MKTRICTLMCACALCAAGEQMASHTWTSNRLNEASAAILSNVYARVSEVEAEIPTNNAQLVNGKGYVTKAVTNGLASAADLAGVKTTADAATDTNALQEVAISGKQPTISANGMLKGDGEGNVTAAAAGEDYVTPKGLESADTSYGRYKAITNVNQSVQYVVTGPSVTELVILPPVSGKTKDWMVYVNAGADLTLVLTELHATIWTSDESNADPIPANQPTVLMFSQIDDGLYFMGRQELVSMPAGN